MDWGGGWGPPGGAGLGGAAGRPTGMLRMSIGESSPVVQTARVKCSIESQCSTKIMLPPFEPMGVMRCMLGMSALIASTKVLRYSNHGFFPSLVGVVTSLRVAPPGPIISIICIICIISTSLCSSAGSSAAPFAASAACSSVDCSCA